eukprot:366024-Chlamydomonas_euryale.AAC.4
MRLVQAANAASGLHVFKWCLAWSGQQRGMRQSSQASTCTGQPAYGPDLGYELAMSKDKEPEAGGMLGQLRPTWLTLTLSWL